MRFFTKPSGWAILGLLCTSAATVPSARADFLFVISQGGKIEELDSSGNVVNPSFATVSGAESLAFNANGDLLVGSSNGKIFEVSPSSTVTTFANGPFNNPVLAVNTAGDVFVGSGNGTIVELSSSGSVINASFATGLGSISALAFGANGNLFVANGSGVTIYEVTPSGIVTPFASAAPFGLGAGLAYTTPTGDLFWANHNNGNIYEVGPSGGTGTFYASTNSILAAGDALAINSSGDLFVSGGNTNTIYEVTAPNTVTPFASVSSPGGLAFQPTIASVPAPSGLMLVLSALSFGGLGLLYRRMSGKALPHGAAVV